MKRNTKFHLIIFCLACCCATSLSCAAFGQAGSEPPVQLTNFAHSAALEASGIGLTQIGSKGFFYAQVIVDHSLTNAIERISFDGTDVTSYSLDRMIRPTYLSGRSPFIESFIVGSDGSVDILADWYKDHLPEIHTIVVFNSDGTVSSIIPVHLKGDPQIMHFAQFGDGRYLLVAGYWGSQLFDRVDAVLMNSSGDVLRQETLRKLSSAEEREVDRDQQQDVDRQKVRQKPQSGAYTKSSAHGTVNKKGGKAAARPDYAIRALFSETVLIQGDDGNIYMARPDRLGMLYRISESGDITPIPLSVGHKPAPKDPHTQLMNGSVHNGELMLYYVKFNRPVDSPKPRTMQSLVIRIYDLESHQLVATYTGDKRNLSPLLVGWEGDTFYFLHDAKRNGKPFGFEIEKATP